ncbi:hypothetical protein BD626DRAFT_99332 [Schizophyllum amplum]|uniref:Uncharacterized protein n=1 Tax=Schizophyllum amplum TaxID=97359 RepID=A0A550CRA8_9AGAR|nr:hypothetical protein BD626DRAFT_99332 [Auriculariopsis ampla]
MDFDRCLAPIPPFVGPRTWVPPIGAHVRGRATTTTRRLTTDRPAYHQHNPDKHNPDRHDLPQHNSGVRRDGEQDDGEGTTDDDKGTTDGSEHDQRQGERGGRNDGGKDEMGGAFILPRACRPLPACSVATSAGLRGCGDRASQGIARACVMRVRVPLTARRVPVVRPCCTDLVPSALDAAKARAHSGGGGQSCCVGGEASLWDFLRPRDSVAQ